MRSSIALVILFTLTLALAPIVRAGETLIVQLNHGMLVKVKNLERVVVAAPDIADVNVITRNELMIIAKRLGETTINIWDARGLTTYLVVVTAGAVADPSKALSDILREPNVQVKVVGDTVILEGSVKTDADKARAESIASAFGKRVVSLLTVEQPSPPPPPATQVLEERLREALKDFPVTVKVLKEDTVLIEGTVTTDSDLKRIEAIAKALARNVILLVRMREPLQILVDAFVAEVDREALRQIGVEWGGGNVTDLLTDALEQVDKARSSGIPVATTGPLKAQIVVALDRLFGVIEVDSSTVFQSPGEPEVGLGTGAPRGRLPWLRRASPSTTLDKSASIFSLAQF